MNKRQLDRVYSSIKKDRATGSNIPKMMKLNKRKKEQKDERM